MSEVIEENKNKKKGLLSAWPAVLALCLAMLVEMLDNTIFTIALPTIGRDLSASTMELQWITIAYSLTFGGLLLLGGSLGDIFGRKKILSIGIAGFGLSSLLVLLCSEPWQLVVVRAMIGSFAAMMAPGTMSLGFRLFDDDALRAKLIGVITTVAMAGFALGPILSGVIIEHMSWKTLLLMNFPIALIALIGVTFGIKGDPSEEKVKRKVDFAGALFSVVFLSSLLFMFTSGIEYGWLSPSTIACYVLILLSGYSFYLQESRTHDPLLKLHMITSNLVGNALLQVAVMSVMVAIMFALTLHFQYVWGWSALKAGFGNLPIILAMLIGTPLTDMFIVKYGQKKTAIIGAVLTVSGMFALIFTISLSYLPLMIPVMVSIIGVRLIMTTAAIGLVGSLPEEDTSVGSALNDTVQEFGNSFGTAVVSMVITIILGDSLSSLKWTDALVNDFFRAERISFIIMTVVSVLIFTLAVRRLSDSHETEDH